MRGILARMMSTGLLAVGDQWTADTTVTRTGGGRSPGGHRSSGTRRSTASRIKGTTAGGCATPRAAAGVRGECRVQVDPAENGNAQRPRHDIGQFERQRVAVAGPERLGHLPDLFNEPAERPIDASRAVAGAKGRSDLSLQHADVHERITRAKDVRNARGRILEV